MIYTGTTPVRERNPELPEHELPTITPDSEKALREAGSAVANMRLLWQNRRLLFWIALAGFFASTLVAFLIPARYESTARLMPPDSPSSSGLAMAAVAMSGAAGGLEGMASDFLGFKSSSDVFVGILSSRTVQDKLIQQFDLRRLYWDRRLEDARRDLASHTNISVDRKSQIITITVTDKNSQRAAAMTGAYVEELNRLVAELSTSSARRERIFLEGRLQAVNQDLEVAEKEFSQFASKNTAIDVKEQGRAMVEGAATLQAQLIVVQSEYEGLKQIYADNNVRVRSAQARIDELKRQLDKIGGKGESATSISGNSGDSMYPSIRKLPLLGVTYADLYRRTKIQEAVLEALTKEYEMAKVQEAKEIPTVRVLDPANIPDKRSFPPRLLIVIMGTFLAFGIGITWLFFKTSWEELSSADPRKLLAQEVFTAFKATLPKFSRDSLTNHLAEGELANWISYRGGDDKAPKTE